MKNILYISLFIFSAINTHPVIRRDVLFSNLSPNIKEHIFSALIKNKTSHIIAQPKVTINNLDKSETTLSKDEFVPQWAKSVVWYQIFPERFRNGDITNDPKIDDIIDADPQGHPKAWHIHPWGSDWYELQDYEKQNGDKELWKHLLRRRYGGDLQGIIDKLDYLQELGVSALYLNPVFDAPSLHKYDGASYHHIDPNFGPDPSGDRRKMENEIPHDPSTWVWTTADELALKLIDKVHERGMRIIFDGVFNHMGRSSFAFKDVIKKQQDSFYNDWFIIKSWDNPSAGTKFDYLGWYGVKSLPELREDDDGIVEGPRDYIFAATERWMNPKNKGIQHGIDGWRLDVAFCIGHPFWKLWRKHVKSINPQAYLTAEIIEQPEKAKYYFQGDEFDGEMNYNFAFSCAEFFFNPDPMSITVSQFDQKLKECRNIYPKGVASVSMSLFGSHDANRIASHIVNRGIGNYRDWGKYFGISKAIDNPAYLVRKPMEEEIRLQKLFVIFQMTYPGAPMIYYGDEAGMWGANDPDCRKPMLWDDITYSPECYNPDGSRRNPDEVFVNTDLLNFYRKMVHMRNSYDALQVGDFYTHLMDDEKNKYIYSRAFHSQILMIAINNSKFSQQVDISIPQSRTVKDILNQKEFILNNNKLPLTLDAKWAAVLLIKD